MIYTVNDLRSEYTARQISSLVGQGHLIRAGRYYLTEGTDEAVVAALTAGVRPTCLTAARHYGLWVPPVVGWHVYARRERAIPTRWVGHGWNHAWPEPDPVASPALMLEHAGRCLDPLDVGILADSALREGHLHAADIAAIRRTAPRAVGRVLDRVSTLAESGTETKVRLFFQLRRVPVRAQVQIPGIGRVDLLVGRRWIIECDSRAHHTGATVYAYDRARDFSATEQGYITTRLTYGMVFGQWDATTSRLTRIVRSRQHLVDPARRAC